MRRTRTQVGIVGAGPAGLLLSHLLHLDGIESVVLEAKSRDYVEKRVRAGVLESPTVQLLDEVGLGDRLHRDGLRHTGIHLAFDGARHHLDFEDLVGQGITVYGQQEVVKDLIARRLDDGGDLRFEVDDVTLTELDGTLDGQRPVLTVTAADGEVDELECDYVAGCDGFHGPTRTAAPHGVWHTFDRDYPFAWLGILAEAPPSSTELIYAYSPRGFALHSMRSPSITRNYLQVPPDTDVGDWPDERIWSELQYRLDAEGEPPLTEGPIVDKGVTPMRSFVTEPMQYGRLFLAGDAAHIVPPTGAKGMNLAIADVWVLGRALAHRLRGGPGAGSDELLRAYSDTCLGRVWRAEHFSWFMTSMLHRFDLADGGDPFQHQLQLSQLRYTATSRAAASSLAENYVGLPLPSRSAAQGAAV
ncbi:MAG TPA: 4-hydroxybenzoate 3-monooxygenase [Frankiaceae bacterium]|nr:4-hydroxybenzoate 3-monooxygenase [Frankiaceae bacterium]